MGIVSVVLRKSGLNRLLWCDANVAQAGEEVVGEPAAERAGTRWHAARVLEDRIGQTDA